MLRFLLIIIAMLTQTAEANWIGRTCTFIFSKIAVDDPYQYEEVRTDALLLYYEQHGVKGTWGSLQPQEAITMNIIGAELRWRLEPVMIQFELPQNIERITLAMELYQEFEGEAVYAKGRR